MYEKTLVIAFFVVIAAAATLVTAISIASQSAHATAVCGPEKDTRGCLNPEEKRSFQECDTRTTRCIR
jgi:hypothetical protein